MKIASIYRGYRFPPDVIAHTVWLYHRFALSLRDVEDLLAERGVTVSYETIRQWCATFGPHFARRIKARLGSRGDRWFLDEVVVSICGERRYLWRAVDQDGDVLNILVQKRKDTKAAKRFFRKLLKGQGPTATGYHDRQAWQLRLGETRSHAVGASLPGPLRQQSSRGFP